MPIILYDSVSFYAVMQDMCDGALGRGSIEGGSSMRWHTQKPQGGAHQHQQLGVVLPAGIKSSTSGQLYQVQNCFFSSMFQNDSSRTTDLDCQPMYALNSLNLKCVPLPT